MTHQFIADLKDSVEQARGKAPGKGTMVTIYGKQQYGPIHGNHDVYM